MKRVLPFIASLSIALMPLTHARSAPVQLDEPAMTSVERLRKIMSEIPSDELKTMAEQEAKSIAMFKEAVDATQVALEGKQKIGELYQLSLSVHYTAVITTAIGGLSTVVFGIGTGMGTVFTKKYRLALRKVILEKPFFQIRQGIHDHMIKYDNFDYKHMGRAPKWFKYSLLTTIASAYVASSVLTESATFNEDQISKLENALRTLSSDLAQHEAYNKFLLQQLALREQAR